MQSTQLYADSSHLRRQLLTHPNVPLVRRRGQNDTPPCPDALYRGELYWDKYVRIVEPEEDTDEVA